MVRTLRLATALALLVSGGLLVVAAEQRWGDACGRGQGASDACSLRQDHLYDFLAPDRPWEPVGQAAQLAGWSLLVLAVALPALLWAAPGHRPGVLTALTGAAGAAATLVVGLTTLRSGLEATVVQPTYPTLTYAAWLFLLPGLLVRLAVTSRGWARAAAVAAFLGMPLVAGISYALGSFDAAPWWEAVAGGFVALAGVMLAVAAVRRPRRSIQPAPPLPAPHAAVR